ncbi:hypothetical protein KVR01_007883 [Diaporthe batatas]|uniref:uncharacterized protein n=1 Tax=Diaporthe batatas TaxID=748121 RepID=UPI001D039147|nr:uncharacterized protein KVR01_007883 [Diaporthe batatas]KAG8162118.1 hypothetical protein KVR01_007883 [Diaporthe batatas]
MSASESVIREHVAHLEGWIQICNKNHGANCHVDPIEGRPPHHIPDWVIDTEDCCIVRGCSVQRYAALSYVWSPKDRLQGTSATCDRLMLKKDNLADFCRKGFLRNNILERVPAVIRDAIGFVQHSGFRYLWIDSLCIVQHEDTTRDRVGLMNEIYSGAYFTIIAASSIEGRGLYGEHYDYDRLPDGPSAHYLHSGLLCSHWASRDHNCFWECESEVQWSPTPSMNIESSEHSVRNHNMRECREWRQGHHNRDMLEEKALRGFLGQELSRAKSQDRSSLSAIPDFKLYIELACRYNNRNFTYDQDALPAFSSILEVLSRRRFHGGFISGLPALFLDSTLLWQPLLTARRRSPSGTATRIAPMAPLPSWSWVGWQCLIDPDSLIGGLDYMEHHVSFYVSFYVRDPFRNRKNSWRIRKLVDWSVLYKDGSVNPVDEPALLQSFKDDSEENHDPLPTGWSRDVTGAFIHANDPANTFRYPLPIQSNRLPAVADRNASLLSCATTIATLRVRRVLAPYREVRPADHSRCSFPRVSVFKTDLYNHEPKLHTLCPVITLEDEDGRWAGAMAVMENSEGRASVQAGSEVKIIAISTGSALQQDVAESYPEMVDSQGFCRYGPSWKPYYFEPRYCRDDLDNLGRDWNGEYSVTAHTRQSIEAGVDVGPFAHRLYSDGNMGSRATVQTTPRKPNHWYRWLRFHSRLVREHTEPLHTVVNTQDPEPNQFERYNFYNVLWVETIDGIMYRKAAGRVPKEIWEQSCGEPTKIVLG